MKTWRLHTCNLHGVIYFLPYFAYQEVNFGDRWCHSVCIGWWQFGLAFEWGFQQWQR